MDPISRPDYSLPPSQMSVRLPRVRNKTPSEAQISAEQLLREALANQIDDIRPPRVQINDDEELEDYLHRKRAEFENVVRKQRYHINAWIKYASFEEGLQNFQRARSIFERALVVDYKNTSLWLKYAEMEMRNKFINYARNVWERAVTLLPRVDQLWYKYAYMEEIVGNYNGARMIFERWLNILPSVSAWVIYAKLEERLGNHETAREIIYKAIPAHPTVETFIKVAKFEEKRKNKQAARKVYEKAIQELGSYSCTEEFYIAFTEFEIRCHEYERARILFKHILEKLPKASAPRLYQSYINFEKQYGTKGSIEIVVINKRRAFYEQILSEDNMRYDTWFDYIYLEEAEGIETRIREVYERAIANVPIGTEKKFWRRYMYFWLNYAVFEENLGYIDKARSIYDKALDIIPHATFSFSKVWVYYALFEVRNLNLDKARKVLGVGIAKSGSEKLFSSYIELEMQLGNIDRCRKLYDKWLQTQPYNCNAWIGFSELEKSLEEYKRSEAILELAVSNQSIDKPEIVWKAYIDFMIEIKNYEKAKEIYERLLTKTKHLKAWISYAKFLISIKSIDEARNILKKAESFFKISQNKEDRALLLEQWLDIENEIGNEECISEIQNKLPKKVKKKRKLQSTNEDAGYEEYLDYIFPDEEQESRNNKILSIAQKWKLQQNS
jgi:crooked neck